MNRVGSTAMGSDITVARISTPFWFQARAWSISPGPLADHILNSRQVSWRDCSAFRYWTDSTLDHVAEALRARYRAARLSVSEGVSVDHAAPDTAIGQASVVSTPRTWLTRPRPIQQAIQ